MSGQTQRRDRLDLLLRVRRIEEDQAKAVLAHANDHARRAVADLDRARRDYAAAPAPVDGVDSAAFLRRQSAAVAAAASVMAADHRRVDAAEQAGQARSAALAASTRSQGMERLLERADQARLADFLAADQRAAEESRAGTRTGGRR
jgi:hypothetical protein